MSLARNFGATHRVKENLSSPVPHYQKAGSAKSSSVFYFYEYFKLYFWTGNIHVHISKCI